MTLVLLNKECALYNIHAMYPVSHGSRSLVLLKQISDFSDSVVVCYWYGCSFFFSLASFSLRVSSI